MSTIAAPELVAAIQREVELVRSWLPWLPWIGVRYKSGTTLTYNYDDDARCHWIFTNGAWSRTIVRHEMGHFWLHVMGFRRPGFSVHQALGVDPNHPQQHEIVAEIFSRAMGEPPLYDGVQNTPDLRDLTVPTPSRVAFIEDSGSTPLEDYATAVNNAAIQTFWNRARVTANEIPTWFETWATNYQEWLRLNILRWMGMVD